MQRKEIEVLAPAGSYDILKAVIEAGADAVYLGGNMFGARAFAGNFNEQELLSALDYAHMRGKKIYLTVNTLLKDSELNDRLVDYIAPYYEAGLDAAIVQDFGVFNTLKKNFPNLHLHASTQMTVTGSKSAALLKSFGASRVVTARELSLSELKQIRNECDIEIESFVHGALCYCYSGQCLLSSMNGGRSGNRGRCAQPCRLAYELYDGMENRINNRNREYALSPKDMCALSLIPDIIEAGVNSLKIEGRMKNVTYAAGVTALYRKYTDMYLNNGREGFFVSDKDIEVLMDIYNRGAFTKGYYNSDKGKSMMSVERPNHMGTPALGVVENVSGRIKFKALKDINRQDVFEADRENSFSSGSDYKKGDSFVMNLPKKYPLHKGRIVYRTKNGKITEQIQQKYVDNKQKLSIELSLFAQAGHELSLTVSSPSVSGENTSITAYVTGETVYSAQSQPADKERLIKQLTKLGNTDFKASAVNVELSGDVFMPVSAVNDLRRRGIEEYSRLLKLSFKRQGIGCQGISDNDEGIAKGNVSLSEYNVAKKSESDGSEIKKENVCAVSGSDIKQGCVLVRTEKQALEVCEYDFIKYVYIDFIFAQSADKKQLENIVLMCHRSGKMVVLALPHILRGKHTKKCRDLILKMSEVGADAYLVRCLEEIGLLSELAGNNKCEGKMMPASIIADMSLYCWNGAAIQSLCEFVKMSGLKLLRITYPYELTANELKQINTQGTETELVVYSRIPLMISEQCVKRTYGRCDASNGEIYLKDRKGVKNTVKSVCDYCYTIMYSNAYRLFDDKELIEGVSPDYVRFELSDENETLEKCISDFKAGESKSFWDGHFTIGVE